MSQTPETRSITRSINVVDKDVEDFHKLAEKGVKLTAQMVPNDQFRLFWAYWNRKKIFRSLLWYNEWLDFTSLTQLIKSVMSWRSFHHRFPVFTVFITGLIIGGVTTGLLSVVTRSCSVLGVSTFNWSSRIDTFWCSSCDNLLCSEIDAPLAITKSAVPVAALLTYFDVLGRMTTTFFITVWMLQSNALTIKVLDTTTCLVCDSVGSISCLQSSLPLALVVPLYNQ